MKKLLISLIFVTGFSAAAFAEDVILGVLVSSGPQSGVSVTGHIDYLGQRYSDSGTTNGSGYVGLNYNIEVSTPNTMARYQVTGRKKIGNDRYYGTASGEFEVEISTITYVPVDLIMKRQLPILYKALP